MAALNSYDAILAALEAGKGQEVFFSKTAPAAQVAGAFHTSWAYTGTPGAGAWVGTGGSTAATMVSCNNNTIGALPFASPTTASGENPRILTVGGMVTTAVAGTVILVDRLADSGPLTTAAGGTCMITMPTGGWERYTDGVGVMAFMESLGTAPAAGSVFTLNYTNTDSVTARVSGPATTAATAHRCFGSGAPWFPLQGNDRGIKSIESISCTTVTASNIALVVCKPLLMLPVTTAFYYTERDLVIQTPKLPKLPVAADSSACLQWIFLAGATTSPTFTGSISLVNA